METTWRDIERPGYFGRKRDEVFKMCDNLYGVGGWRIAWKWLGGDINFDFACHLYEDGYFNDSFKREELWKNLTDKAKDVWDIEERDIESGFDYKHQIGRATHLQDIAIRRVVARRGWRFTGNELVQIRGHSNYWGNNLNPGRVPFHLPQHIVGGMEEESDIIDRLTERRDPWTLWWDKNSIEDFYQSNKVLQVLEK